MATFEKVTEIIDENKVMKFTGIWMNVENTLSSGFIQTQEDEGNMFSLICES